MSQTTGTVFLSTGAQFTNAGTFTASNTAAGISNNGGAASLFTNSGAFTINLLSAASTYSISVPVSNSGSITVQNGNLNISTSDNGATPGTFSVNAGMTLTLSGNFAFTGNGTITGNGTAVLGGTDSAQIGISIASLTINHSLQIAANGTSTGTTRVNTLTIPGNTTPSGTFDLTNNRVIVEPAASKATVLATLQAQTNYGKSHTTGIRSTALPANTGLAVFDNGARPVPFTTFGGQPADSGSILIGPELLGDANIDGTVDLTDLSTILNNFGATTPAWTNGNFDGAATIDLTDLSDVLNNFGSSNPNFFTAQLPTTNYQLPPTPTPEPTSLALLGFASSLPLTKRRRTS